MKYDVIVVGGGHAGCEACLATSKMGLKTLLVSGNLNMLGSMPCNPSIGGPAKGVVVREIDALGGWQGKNADLTRLQIKMLNSSKGPAVRALRSQNDKVLYSKEMRKHLEAQENLDLYEAYTDHLIVENNTVKGIVNEDGSSFEADAVILTTGTYLSSLIFRGHHVHEAGPDEQATSHGLSKQLKDLGFDVRRLKTGTPPRIKASSIDFSKSILAPGEDYPYKFSFDEGYDPILGVNIPCYLTYTNPEIHKIVADNIHESAMYGGVISGVEPRYCPSIETKIIKFKDKDRHQVFLEPESLEWDQTYLGEFSTSMPEEIQDKMIRLIPGLENCEIIKYSYSIEYDSINPLQLYSNLETKLVKNLFCAGQINGTSGYEEAAGQGIMAGINAGLKLQGKEPLVLRRDESYIGVLIDDLVTKGTNEPYRLLTSRAEYRLLLRNDNSDLRLREYGYQVGLISDEQYEALRKKKKDIAACTEYLNTTNVVMSAENNAYLESIGSSTLKESQKGIEVLKRPEISFLNFRNLIDVPYSDEVLEQVEIEAKYQGYIRKALAQADKLEAMDNKVIPDNINYDDIDNIALEAREKFKKIMPRTLGQASRISGVNPADIAVLSVYLDALRRR
ncbi:MAG: tRNA uridine-5-carboxymethylaminomethyl(34) synthesis enzyme MnmG [Acholeplasmatales bacterium]|nr:tRNA uridine-5-carboxymethylaminomethyl(34) synthesis enzyme MnmG [Acholeplasmatales bacterium]